MEAKLKQECMSRYSCVYQHEIHREETVESVVPDVLPDIGTILDTQCILLMRSKNSQEGKATGELLLQATVVYAAESGDGLYKLELTQPIYTTFESDELAEGDILHFQIGVNGADGRTLNPRKILLRADIAVVLSAYRLTKQYMAVAPEEGEPLETLKKECDICAIGQVGEKTFGVTDEFLLTPTHPAIQGILLAQPTVSVDEMKQVGEKVILQGTAAVKVLYAAEDGTVYSDGYSTIFSQIMDCPENAAGPNTVTLIPSGFHLDLISSGNEQSLRMEMYLIAQVLCRVKETVSYLADAYCLQRESSLNIDTLPVIRMGEVQTHRDTIRDFVELIDTVGDIKCCRLSVSTPQIGDGQVETNVSAQIYYQNIDGNLSTVNRKLRAVFTMDMGSNITACAHPLKVLEPYVQAAAGGIEIRLPIEQTIETYKEDVIEMVSSIDISDEKTEGDKYESSLIVARREQADLWCLAKKYKSTVALIEQANPEPVEIGELLLIPRPR